jgi:hypothetical protein
VPSAGRSVLTIELDKLTPEEREDLNRRRAATLERALEMQARRDRNRANERNRTAARGEQRGGTIGSCPESFEITFTYPKQVMTGARDSELESGVRRLKLI